MVDVQWSVWLLPEAAEDAQHLVRRGGYLDSGFSSIRISLSPFTKDFRGEEHL